MTHEEQSRFKALRKAVMDAIAEELREDGHCKSYEGTFELIAGYPNFFEDEAAISGPDRYCIRLHCYVLGPFRHYDWIGKTFSEALDKAEKETKLWIEG